MLSNQRYSSFEPVRLPRGTIASDRCERLGGNASIDDDKSSFFKTWTLFDWQRVLVVQLNH